MSILAGPDDLNAGEAEEHDDDRPVGRILSRREVLALFGLTGASALLAACQPTPAASPTAASTSAATLPPAVLPTVTPTPAVSAELATVAAIGESPAAQATIAADVAAAEALNAIVAPACVARPEMTEGPYFMDVRLNRSDIRADANLGLIKEGAPLQLTFRVSEISADACTPLAGALVDIWHCDAQGAYSAVTDRSFNTTSENWLRGYQVTSEQGAVTFSTIYPGWYPGRTVHIHFKVRTDPDSTQGYEFTSQLFFDDTLTDQVLAQPPYNVGGNRTRNAQDSIYDDLLLLTVTPAAEGFAATFDLALDLS